MKEYIIEILCDDEPIKGMENMSFSLDKHDFNDMILLVDYVSLRLSEASLRIIDFYSISLRVYSSDDLLFDSLEAFDSYKDKHRIESRMDSSLGVHTYVNGILYEGEVTEDMLDHSYVVDDLDDLFDYSSSYNDSEVCDDLPF